MDASSAAVATLSLLRIGVVLVGPDGEVLTANHSAQKILAQPDGLSVSRTVSGRARSERRRICSA